MFCWVLYYVNYWSIHKFILGGKTFPARSFPPDGTTFSHITLGQKLSKEIVPYGYWNMQFYQSEPAYVKFDYSIPRGASIAVYGRRNALPTHTQYHILEVLSGFKARTSRASHVSLDLSLWIHCWIDCIAWFKLFIMQFRSFLYYHAWFFQCILVKLWTAMWLH